VSDEALEIAAASILAIACAHPVRVGIDGRSTAGKTTFRDALAERLARSGRPVLRASIDDFHPPGHGRRSAAGGYTVESYYAEGYDYAAVRDRLLRPLGPGGDRRCRLALHDSASDVPKGEDVLAPNDALVVVDGDRRPLPSEPDRRQRGPRIPAGSLLNLRAAGP
jgi:uridine kinase